jgi:hypothetical protein
MMVFCRSYLIMLVEKHQAINRKINRLQNDCEAKKQYQRKITESLFHNIEKNSSLLHQGKSLLSLKSNNDSFSEPIDVNDLLLYSSRVARHTLSAITPPIPQDDQMRSSKLFAIGDKLKQNGDHPLDSADNIPYQRKETVKIDLEVDGTGVFISNGAQDGYAVENDGEELLDLF